MPSRGEVAEVEVIVVGAGPAGLSTAASLHHYGASVLIIEADQHLGASWTRHYERLKLHTTKRFSALPGLRFPKSASRYPTRDEFLAYLNNYASSFNLQILCGQPARQIFPEGARWVVKTENQTYLANNVVVATGLNRVPFFPQYPGFHSSDKRFLHSSQYRNATAYSGKRILVVGLGNSGAEIALDLAQGGANVSVSVRGPVHVVPRDILGIPAQALAIWTHWLPRPVLDPVFGLLVRALTGDLKSLGISTPREGITRSCERTGRAPVLDTGTLGLIRQGKIKIFSDISKILPCGIEFVGGLRSYFDRVIFATGYRPGFRDFMEVEYDSFGQPVTHPDRGLYFTGFYFPITGALRQIGREATEIARSIARKPRRHNASQQKDADDILKRAA